MLHRSLEKDGNWFPSLINTVKGIPESYYAFNAYRLKDPRTETKILFESLFSNLNRFLDNREVAAGHIQNEMETEANFESLRVSANDLIGNFKDFIEQCFQIFKAVTPVNPRLQLLRSDNTEDWLKQADFPTIDWFRSNISSYRKELEEWEHRNNHQNLTVGRIGKQVIIGYGEEGHLKTFRNLLHIVRYHLCRIYEISDVFFKRLSTALHDFYDKELSPVFFETDLHVVEEVLYRLQFPEEWTFPNVEFLSAKPSFKITKTILTLDFPVGITPEKIRYVRTENVKGTSFNKSIFIPTRQTVEKIDNYVLYNNGMWGSYEIPALKEEANYHEAVFTIGEEEGTKVLALDYPEFFKLKTSPDMKMFLILPSGEKKEAKLECPKQISIGEFDLKF